MRGSVVGGSGRVAAWWYEMAREKENVKGREGERIGFFHPLSHLFFVLGSYRIWLETGFSVTEVVLARASRALEGEVKGVEASRGVV